MSAAGDRGAWRGVSSYFVPAEDFRRGPAGGFYSVEDIEQANRGAGLFFFSADTRRFFGSRIGSSVYGGRFFVTSERDSGPGPAWAGARRYSVRFVRCDGSIETVGDFGAYDSSRAANRAAARAAHLFGLRAGVRA